MACLSMTLETARSAFSDDDHRLRDQKRLLVNRRRDDRNIRGIIATRFWTIDDIAHDLALSRRTFQQHLNVCGASFSVLFSDVRMEEAFRLLQSTRKRSIEDVGVACGFRDVVTFYRASRRQYGATPAAARELTQRFDAKRTVHPSAGNPLPAEWPAQTATGFS
jgi:AraC-like DNA-binding protein